MRDVLLRGSSWKILEVLLEQPWEQFYTRELIRKSKTGPNTAVRSARELEKAGILTSEKKGNIKAYRMNPGSAMPKKLLLLYHEKRLDRLPEEFKVYVNRLRRKLEGMNIISIVLFGSVAKGTFKEESDIDILVIYEGKIDTGKISEIFERYSRYVQLVDFRKSEFDNMHKKGNELIINILRSGLIVYDKDFYINYLFNPLPKPGKDYIEGMLKQSDERIKELWKLYREGKIEIITSLLHPMINWISTAIVLLDSQIPQSRKDLLKRLEKMKEKKAAKWLKITRKIWDGEDIQLSKKEVENVLVLMENKLKECYAKLEVYQ